MTTKRLEDFALSIGAAVGFAQKETRTTYRSEARVTSMDVDLAATVERLKPGDGDGALALRIGKPKRNAEDFMRLSIGVRGAGGEQVEVRLEGQLLGRYGSFVSTGHRDAGDPAAEGEVIEGTVINRGTTENGKQD